MESSYLTPATHETESQYWEGGNYELNMSFDALRDKQWQRVLQSIWNHPRFKGPLESRYTPGSIRSEIGLVIPPPTAAQTQHGQLQIAAGLIGCDVQSTRSLFECVSVMVPLGMFSGLIADQQSIRRSNPALSELDDIFAELAITVYDAAPFRLAVIGWERECQIVAELVSDAQLRAALIEQGGFIAQEETLRLLSISSMGYELIRPGLFWAPIR